MQELRFFNKNFSVKTPEKCAAKNLKSFSSFFKYVGNWSTCVQALETRLHSQAYNNNQIQDSLNIFQLLINVMDFNLTLQVLCINYSL